MCGWKTLKFKPSKKKVVLKRSEHVICIIIIGFIKL